MALTQLKTGAIADDAVTTDKLANAINTERTANTAKVSLTDNSVTLAKMAGGTDGQIITYDASGDPVAVGPGTDGQVLTSTGAGSPPAFETLPTSGATLTGSTDNTICTVTGANAIAGEANLTYNGTRLDVKTGDLQVIGAEDGDAQLRLTADEGDDGADYWRLESKSSDNNFNLATYASGAWVDKLSMNTSGHLMLGTSTKGNATADDLTIATTSNTGITIRSGTSNEGNIFFADGTSGADEYRGTIQYNHGSNFLTIGTDGSERMRIDSSGVLLVGATSSAGTGTVIEARHDSNSQQGRIMANGIVARNNYGSPTNLTNGMYSPSDNVLAFATDSTERMRITSNGDILHQNVDKTYAACYKNLSNSQSNNGMDSTGVLVFTTGIANMSNTNQYNTSNGRYTAPIKGFYLVQFRGLIDDSRNTGNSSAVWLHINGSNSGISIYYEQVDYSKYRSVTGSSIIPMEANDYLELSENGTGALHVASETQVTFSLYRAHL